MSSLAAFKKNGATKVCVEKNIVLSKLPATAAHFEPKTETKAQISFLSVCFWVFFCLNYVFYAFEIYNELCVLGLKISVVGRSLCFLLS